MVWPASDIAWVVLAGTITGEKRDFRTHLAGVADSVCDIHFSSGGPGGLDFAQNDASAGLKRSADSGTSAWGCDGPDHGVAWSAGYATAG